MDFVLCVLLIVFLVLARVPVALALFAGTVLYYLFTPIPPEIAAQQFFSGLSVFTLLAIPMFVLVGSIMSRGGVAQALMGFADSLVGHWRGGLAQVNVLNSLTMGGMTGSSVADATVDSRILVPAMRKSGYSNAFSTAISAASGIIAPILPPGIGMLIYGLVTQTSVSQLFLGGIVPAFMLAIAMSVAVYLVSRKRGYGAATPRQGFRKRGRALLYAIPALMMPVILIFGLRGGIFTPTELSAIAVAFALLVALVVYRKVGLRELPEVVAEAVETSASVMILVAAGLAFGSVLSLEGVSDQLADFLADVTANEIVLLLLINAFLLVVGMMVDGPTAIVLFAPVLATVASAADWDPTHFGVMVVLNLTIGGITPPLGIVVLAATQVTRARIADTFRETVPFTLGAIVVLLIVAFVPETVTVVPEWLQAE